MITDSLAEWDLSPLDELEVEFRSAGGDARFFAQSRYDTLFGLSCIGNDLTPVKRCLEVGAGPGLLSYLLARNGMTVDALEPLGPGFSRFSQLLDMIEGRNHDRLTILRTPIEAFHVEGDYDFIYSINVFEHIRNWRLGLTNIHRALKRGGIARILCPNYEFPYEPHFSIPILFSKGFTFWVLRNKICKYERERNAVGLWTTLNFINSTDIRLYCRKKGIRIAFDKRIMVRMLERLQSDPEFKNRHRALLPLVNLALKFRADRLMLNLPLRIQPYILLTIQK